MDSERHQALTQAFTVVTATCLQSWIAPRVAWCFLAMATRLMEPMFTDVHIWRVPEADFEIGGRRYGVFAHDWRVETAKQWLRLKAEHASRIDDTDLFKNRNNLPLTCEGTPSILTSRPTRGP